jgi:hypothetical protein
MPDSVELFKARSQLFAHQIGCQCAPCRDARQLIDADAKDRRDRMIAELDELYPPEPS